MCCAVGSYIKMMENVAKAFEAGVVDMDLVRQARIRESSHVQPYLLWLLKVARRVTGHFAEKLITHFGSDPRFE